MQVITALTNFNRSLSIHTPLRRGSDTDFQLNLTQLEELLVPPLVRVVAPLSEKIPEASHARLWDDVLQWAPSKQDVARMLSEHITSVQSTTSAQLVGPPNSTIPTFHLDISRLHTHTNYNTLSARAEQLLKANYVSLGQFCVTPARDNSPELLSMLFWIHAHVHSYDHQVLLRIPHAQPLNYEACCTCLVG